MINEGRHLYDDERAEYHYQKYNTYDLPQRGTGIVGRMSNTDGIMVSNPVKFAPKSNPGLLAQEGVLEDNKSIIGLAVGALAGYTLLKKNKTMGLVGGLGGALLGYLIAKNIQ
jgi:hypothetical protein